MLGRALIPRLIQGFGATPVIVDFFDTDYVLRAFPYGKA